MAPRTILAKDITLLAPIGSGGQSTVYWAKLSGDLEKSVAIKLYRNLDTAAWSYRVEREILLEADHPSIPKLLGFFDTEQFSGLVLDLLVGTSLSALLGSASPNRVLFSSDVVAYMMETLLSAISHLHDGLGGKLGTVIHGDVAPDNVFLTDDGGVYLLDFGAAHLVPPLESRAFGKIRYLAPEQLEGGLISTWSDLYSLGAVIL